jgi:polysaccharide biosynthesis transport protein
VTGSANISNSKFVQLLAVYWAWRRLWGASTLLFCLLAVLYCSTFKTDTWVASQGLIVRDEANGAVMRLGRFQSQTEMKAAQETILEMAKNAQVVGEALRSAGAPEGWLAKVGAAAKDEAWPRQRDIATFAEESIGVHAPQGAEFGTTEVIYLDVKEASPERAIVIIQALCQALDGRLREVRRARADGVIAELEHANRMAHAELIRATDRLAEMEREAGTDLADLRSMTDTAGGGSNSRLSLESVRTERRAAETQHKQLQSDLELLSQSVREPERMWTAPASVLNTHPGLKRLREGLVDTQLQTSQLRGRFTDSHPLVEAAITAETEIRQQFLRELAQAVEGVRRDLENSQARLDLLAAQEHATEQRLAGLARIRALYGNVLNDVRTWTTMVQDSERELAEARASRDAATSTSLLTKIDQPVLGDKPIGPGRETIIVAGGMAGLFLGLGIVFLLTPLDLLPGTVAGTGRRWSDYGPAVGRRLTDRFPWLGEQPARATAEGVGRRSSDQQRRGSDSVPSPQAATAGHPVPGPQVATAPAGVNQKPSGAKRGKEPSRPAAAGAAGPTGPAGGRGAPRRETVLRELAEPLAVQPARSQILRRTARPTDSTSEASAGMAAEVSAGDVGVAAGPLAVPPLATAFPTHTAPTVGSPS